jgi:hypothetical protein
MRCGVLSRAAIVIVAVLAAGCWNPFGPPGGDPKPPNIDRKTPDNLMEFFATVYADKDIDRYEEALDKDYLFEFMEADWGPAGVSEANPYWGKTEDVPRTEAMFTSPQTKAITIEFNQLAVNWQHTMVTINVDGEEQLVDAFERRYKPEIQVTVEDGDELTTYWVHQSWVDVTVIKDRFDSTLWTIIKMVEMEAY